MRPPLVRIVRLEARIPRGCDRCRTWSPVLLMDDAGAVGRPEACPACGRVVPIIARVRIVGVPLDAV